ncbi:hypothetical protein BGX23_006488 [Mortierella sp. AD031]|nr:hypothetical protein BGX23_006488 [Mortierella sp. AD031]
MSFADLERGEGGFRRTGGSGPSPLGGGGNGNDNNNNSGNNNSNNQWNSGGNQGNAQAAFSAKVNQISQQVFRISSNVSSIQRLVGFLGTNKDTEDVRDKLHDLTEQTRLQVKETSQEIKDLARLDNTHGKKLEHNKLSKDFQKVLVEFQKVQRISAEKQREFVDRARYGTARTDYSMFDSIENNVTSISMSTHAAAEELTTAAIHQRNARKKACYLLLIVAVVAGIVILAILS